MKKLFNIWASMAIATIIVTVLYLCSGCTEVNAANESTEYYYEDNFVTAPCEGICLQDIQFNNGSPFYNGKPCILTSEVCELLTRIFYGNDWEQHPVAAIAFDCNEYFVIELD